MQWYVCFSHRQVLTCSSTVTVRWSFPYWKWADKANGTLYAYDEGEMADGATATAVFYGNRVNVIENFTDYSEEDDLVLRSIYTTVLEAAY